MSLSDVVTCLQILQSLYDLHEQITSNNAECKRLVERVYVLKDPLQALKNHKDDHEREIRQKSLRSLERFLNEVKSFIQKHTKNSLKTQFLNISMARTYGGDLGDFHARLTQHITDLSFAIQVDDKLNRKQDLEDLKTSYAANLTKAYQDMNSLNGEEIQKFLNDIANQNELIVTVMQELGHNNVSARELEGFNETINEIKSSFNEQVNRLINLDKKVDQMLAQTNETKHNEVLRNKKKSIDSLSVEMCIGSGGFGEVYCGSADGSTFAIKRINDKSERKAAELEVLIMEHLSPHMNILTCYGIAYDHQFTYLLLDLSYYGSLWSLINDTANYPTDKFPKSLFIAWLVDVIDAIDHMHANRIIHRDIKCENVLIFDNLTIKVCDYGISRQMSSQSVLMTRAGTSAFMAPETHLLGRTSFKSDCFAWAITATQLLRRAQPDTNKTKERLIDESSSVFNDSDLDLRVELKSILTNAAADNIAERSSASLIRQQLRNSVLKKLGGNPREIRSQFRDQLEDLAYNLKKATTAKWKKVDKDKLLQESSRAYTTLDSSSGTSDFDRRTPISKSHENLSSIKTDSYQMKLSVLSVEQVQIMLENLNFSKAIQSFFCENKIDGFILSKIKTVQNFYDCSIPIKDYLNDFLLNTFMNRLAFYQENGVPPDILVQKTHSSVKLKPDVSQTSRELKSKNDNVSRNMSANEAAASKYPEPSSKSNTRQWEQPHSAIEQSSIADMLSSSKDDDRISSSNAKSGDSKIKPVSSTNKELDVQYNLQDDSLAKLAPVKAPKLELVPPAVVVTRSPTSVTAVKANVIVVAPAVVETTKTKDHATAANEAEFLDSAKVGNISVLKRILDKTDINIEEVQDAYGNKVLNLAAFHRQHSIIEFLLSKGANINVKNNFGYTPLMKAAQAGHIDTIHLLIGANADLFIKSKDGKTAYEIAKKAGNLEAKRILKTGMGLPTGGCCG